MINLELNELASYSGHEPGLLISIYNSNNGLLKKCVYKGEVEWLKVGESTYKKG